MLGMVKPGMVRLPYVMPGSVYDAYCASRRRRLRRPCCVGPAVLVVVVLSVGASEIVALVEQQLTDALLSSHPSSHSPVATAADAWLAWNNSTCSATHASSMCLQRSGRPKAEIRITRYSLP
jgi:hypothetical protein